MKRCLRLVLIFVLCGFTLRAADRPALPAGDVHLLYTGGKSFDPAVGEADM